MARHLIYIGKKQYSADAERNYTHVLTGQRNEAHFKPKIDPRKVSQGTLSAAERVTVQAHAQRAVSGHFAVKPLEWCESAAEAEAAKARFAGPEWVNLAVVEVKTRIP